MWQWFKRRTPSDRDLDDEIRFHLAEETKLRTEAGLDAGEAHASARRAFGNVALVSETTRDVWGRSIVATFAQDVRYGIRRLLRYRLFAPFP